MISSWADVWAGGQMLGQLGYKHQNMAQLSHEMLPRSWALHSHWYQLPYISIYIGAGTLGR